MPKKKRTQLKPVARGFATTSVPKKVLPDPIVDTNPATSSSIQSTPEDPTDTVKGLGTTTTITASNEEFDPDLVDEQSIQNLIDKFQEKTEKEIVRYTQFTYVLSIYMLKLRLNRTIKVTNFY